MPFTLSHPAAILPLTYLPTRWFSLTGLVIGSLTPDFEYFLRMRLKSLYGHTVAGLFWFDLPLGLALAFIFHNQVRNSLFDNLPPFLGSRFQAFRQFDWNGYFIKNIGIVVVSILVGAASHLLWDSFTHDRGYFVRTIQELAGTFVSAKDRTGPSLNPLVWLTDKHGATIFAVVLATIIAALPAPGDSWGWATAGKGGLILWPLFGATNQLLAGLSFLVISFFLWRRNVPVWFITIPMIFMLIMPAYALCWNMFNSQAGWFWPLQEMVNGGAAWEWNNKHLLFFIGMLTLALQIWMVIEGVIVLRKTRGLLEEPLPPLPVSSPVSAGGSD